MATNWENSCSLGLRYVSWYKYLIVSLVFSHLGFWSGNLFLIAPFPDLCLLLPFFGRMLHRVRLGSCKTGLSPPVTLCSCQHQGDTSVVVLFVLCLGVYLFFFFLYCWRLMYVFIFIIKLR